MENITDKAAQSLKNDEMLKYFIELMSTTKHMVDEILPDRLLLMDKSMIDTIKRHCEELDGSMQVFVKLCGIVSRKNLLLFPAVNISDKTEVPPKLSAHPPSSTESGQDSKTSTSQSSTVTNSTDLPDDGVWKSLIDKIKIKFEARKALHKFYYCGLCNIRCQEAEHVWLAHLKGKKHTERSEELPHVKVLCDTCGFHIISDEHHVSMIMESPQHRSLDEWVIREIPDTYKTDENSPEENSKNNVESPTSEPKPKTDSSVCNVDNGGDEVGEVKFKGMIICSNFVVLTSKILERLEKRKTFCALFCRPCDVICKCTDDWIDHINTSKHISMMKSKSHFNILCVCVQCDFGLVASKTIARGYMCYHIENCHNQSTDNIIDEEYMTITPVMKQKMYSGNSSVASSLKGSVDDVHSSVNNEAATKVQGKSAQHHSLDDSVKKSNEQSANNNSKSMSSEAMPKANVRSREEVKFKGKIMCPNFVELTSALVLCLEKRKAFTACFCRPCDVICRKKLDWIQHIRTSKHKSLMERKEFDNVLCACVQCDFGMLASNVIARCYMYYHIEKCHNKSTDNINDEAYMTITPIKRKNNNSEQKSGNSSVASSLKGSVDDVHSSVNNEAATSSKFRGESRRNRRRNRPSPKDFGLFEQDGSRSSSRASSVSYPVKKGPVTSNIDDFSAPDSFGNNQRKGGSSSHSSRIQSPVCDMEVDDAYGYSTRRTTTGEARDEITPPRMSTDQPPQQVPVSEDNDIVALFIAMLHSKEASFLEGKKQYKPFSALCLLCPSTKFSDSFAWFDHVSTHSSQSEIYSEYDCNYCNSYFYGITSEIRERFIFHEEHQRLDRLMR